LAAEHPGSLAHLKVDTDKVRVRNDIVVQAEEK
jgi:hypothetical protein